MINVLAVYGHYGCFNANGGGKKKKEVAKREGKKEIGNRNQRDKQ